MILNVFMMQATIGLLKLVYCEISLQNHSGNVITKRPKTHAIIISSNDVGGYIFRMPENMLKELAGYDCTYAIEIQAEAE